MTVNLHTLIFYAVSITIVEMLDKISPSGPFVPGLGVVSFLLLIPVVGVLVVRNI